MSEKKDHPRRRAIRVSLSHLLEAFRRQPAHVRRLRSVFVLFAVSAVLLGVRLVDLQIVRADDLAESASEFRTRTEKIQAKRGDILDSSGAVLATSVERYNVGVNREKISEYIHYEKNEDEKLVAVGTGAAEAAKQLAPLLELDQAELGGLMLGGHDDRTFVYLKKDISPELWREIRALGIYGIEPEQVMKREYPNGDVAGNILGYIGLTGETQEGVKETPTGQAGIERTQEDVLTGEDGSITYQVADGTILPNAQRTEVPSVNGSNVRLTINRDLQKTLQDALNTPVNEQGAEWASAAVLEIGTNRVLALAESGTPNPGDLAGTSPENWGSRSVQAVVEPGSTGKLITFAAGIDQGTITPESTFYVPDTITMPNGESISDNDAHGAQELTTAGILAYSYNTGLVQIGDTIPDEVRFEYMEKFGIGSKTGIELPAESGGLLWPMDSWDNRTRYTTMFGQGWAATTLQLAQMVSIIGNDGVRVPVHIIDSTIAPDGQETPTVVGDSERVISSESSHTMLDMMQAVTDTGSTGWRAAVPGYNIAGKTGTAQVPDENGQLTKRVGTFVGVVPAEDPQIAIAVTVYNADGAGYGGDVAAPVFKDTVSFAVRQLGIPPSTVPLVRLPWYPGEVIESNG